MRTFGSKPVSLWASLALVLACLSVGFPTWAQDGDWDAGSDWDKPSADWGKPDDWLVKDPKKPKPTGGKPRKQISGAETMVPMPGKSSIFMSQLERKKAPPPEYLIAKVHWGGFKEIPNMGTLEDWNLTRGDITRLGALAREQNLAYLHSYNKLEDFDFNPKRMPALYISGVRLLKFKPHHVKALREYVLNGGTIICDSVYGSPWFYRSARHLFDDMFPESAFRVVPEDHPLFHIASNIHAADYAYGEEPETGDRPYLEAIYIGSRLGVVLSKYGLGCGLEGQMKTLDLLVERNLKPKAYGVETAQQIGRNMVAYVVGYGTVGEIEGRPELFGIADQKHPASEFVFTEIRHGGGWNVHPNAAQALLKKLERHSSIRVNYRRFSVDPKKDDLSRYPCLFWSGQDDFVLDRAAVDRMRTYLLEDDGILVINNGLGLATFHKAVRRELARILPGSKYPLQRLDPDHDLFNIVHNVTEVEYTPALADKSKELGGKPWFEGITINGELRVIYSPYDFIAGWNETSYPQMRGYQSESAWRIGVNLITYIMTH